jgi:pyrimidine oxygenase
MPNVPGTLRIGLFLPNEYANQFVTAAPEMTDSTYASNRRVAVVADEIGLSFALTVARWKGIPGESVGYACHGIDPFTLAAAILEATEKITVISTAHTIVWNPAVIAKMGADLDHIGRGRWGLNLVAGWSASERRTGSGRSANFGTKECPRTRVSSSRSTRRSAGPARSKKAVRSSSTRDNRRPG